MAASRDDQNREELEMNDQETVIIKKEQTTEMDEEIIPDEILIKVEVVDNEEEVEFNNFLDLGVDKIPTLDIKEEVDNSLNENHIIESEIYELNEGESELESNRNFLHFESNEIIPLDEDETTKVRNSTLKKKGNNESDQIYECEICFKQLSNKNTLKNHLRIHENSGHKRFSCNFCAAKFAHPKNLKTHHLKRHVQIFHATSDDEIIINHVCITCNKIYSTEEQLQSHVISNHNINNQDNIKECSKTFKYSTLLTGQEEEIKRHSCTICFKQFATKKYVRDHVRRIHVRKKELEGEEINKRHSCTMCLKKFAKRKGLRDHVRRIHFNRDNKKSAFVCSEPECGKKFVRRVDLRDHALRHVTGQEKPYFCRGCPQKFASRKYFEKHVLKSSNSSDNNSCHVTHVLRLNCGTCNQEFSTEEQLENHVISSHNNRINDKNGELKECWECREKFTCGWKDHWVLKHAIPGREEPEHFCTVCFKHFATERSVKDHGRRNHLNGEKQTFICPEPECGKKFARKDYLQDHALSHETGLEKNYSCSVCQKKFSLRRYLSQHVKSLHGASDLEGLVFFKVADNPPSPSSSASTNTTSLTPLLPDVGGGVA